MSKCEVHVVAEERIGGAVAFMPIYRAIIGHEDHDCILVDLVFSEGVHYLANIIVKFANRFSDEASFSFIAVLRIRIERIVTRTSAIIQKERLLVTIFHHKMAIAGKEIGI